MVDSSSTLGSKAGTSPRSPGRLIGAGESGGAPDLLLPEDRSPFPRILKCPGCCAPVRPGEGVDEWHAQCLSDADRAEQELARIRRKFPFLYLSLTSGS
jgi:hypothetical protein